ncbi:MAG: hypothetical protein IPG57_22125 [Burkholderiales bacterium]|jgi:hypothetical protein|nr:hypothetical protein [Burkholderiales bacterium]
MEGSEVHTGHPADGQPQAPDAGTSDWAWLDSLAGPLDADFRRAVEAGRPVPAQGRPDWDTLFD